MRIAITQTMPTPGNIRTNIENHCYYINRAADNNSDAIFFPELSLTGYEPQLAERLAIDPYDKILSPLSELSEIRNITVAAGIPIRAGSGVRIGMIIFQPFRERQIYSKMILHPDEIPYFTNGSEQLLIKIKDTIAAPAICYESLQQEHSKSAVMSGARVYIVSAAKSQSGMDKANEHFPRIARKHDMPVLISNSTGYCDNFFSCGQSAVWNNFGTCVARLNLLDEGFIIYDTVNREVFYRISD